MIRFSWKMIVADLKRSLRGGWWMGPVIFIMLVVLSFMPDINIGAFSYFIVAGLALFKPQFSRIHYVLPLSEKQIKKLFVWRIVIVCVLMIVISGVVIAISEWKNLVWNGHGLNLIAFYMVLLIGYSEVSLKGLGGGKVSIMRTIVGITGAVISMLIAFGILTDYMPYKWTLAISYGMVLAAVGYMICYLKNVKFEDFTYVPVGMWDDGKVERK